MRRGYTLFELLIVVAVVLILAGISIPSIESMYADSRLEAAADQVAGQWSAMRARAITEGRSYRFAVQPGGGDFRAAPDAPEFWSGADPPPVSANEPNAPLVVQDSLPTGIRFASIGGDDPAAAANPDTGEVVDASATASASGSWTTVAVFLPDGTAQQDQEITFRSALSGPLSLKLRALTGGMSTRWLPANQGP